MAATITPQAHRSPIRRRGTLSPREWAEVIGEEDRELGIAMTPRELAEGVATVQLESSGNASNEVQGPSGHIGGWSEEPGFGSESERLDPWASTRAAVRNWASNGESWWQAWGQWEKEQGGRWGGESAEYGRYLGLARRVLRGAPSTTRRDPSPAAAGEGSAPGGIEGDLLRFGLAAALVIGGAVLVTLGATRALGRAGAPG